MKSNRPILKQDNTENAANNLNQFNDNINSNPYNAAWFNTFFLPSDEVNGLVNEISPINQLDKPISSSKTTINLAGQSQSLATVKSPLNEYKLTTQSNKDNKKSNSDSYTEKNNNHKKRKKNSDSKTELHAKNREIARAFRERQRERVVGLETKMENLTQEETELNDAIKRLRIENLSLIEKRNYYRNILSQSTIFYKKEAHHPGNASGQNNLANSTVQSKTLQNSKKK